MRRSLALALPALLSAAPALALTPEELWSTWQAQAAGFGVTLEAQAVPGAGGALTLRNWRRALPGGVPEPLPADSPVQELVLTPTADGGVAIDLVGLPESGTLPGAAEEMGDLYLREQGLTITAYDGTDAAEYVIAADSIQGATVAAPGGNDLDNFAAEVRDLVLRVPGDIGPDRQVTASLAMSGFAYLTNSGDPDFGMASTQSARSEGDMTLTASLTIPEGIDWEAMDGPAFVRALDAGLSLRIDLVSGATVQSAWVDGFPFSYGYESESGPGQGSVTLDRRQVALEGEFGGGSFALTLPEAGYPRLETDFGPMRTEVRVPLTQEVGDLRYLLSLESLTPSAETWAALDPQGSLPHDPIGLTVDAGARFGFDLAATVAADAVGQDGPPPQLDSVTLNVLEFSGAGLEVSATGSLAFPGGDPDAEPTGTGSVRLVGVDRLLDALVARGFITSDDATGARLGLLAVFRPGAEPDTREAVIELREGGAVFANGVQVQ